MDITCAAMRRVHVRSKAEGEDGGMFGVGGEVGMREICGMRKGFVCEKSAEVEGHGYRVYG